MFMLEAGKCQWFDAGLTTIAVRCWRNLVLLASAHLSRELDYNETKIVLMIVWLTRPLPIWIGLEKGKREFVPLGSYRYNLARSWTLVLS